MICRDPESGYSNVGTYRVQVHDEKTVGLWIIPGKHGNLIAQKYWSKGEDCPFLIACGLPPSMVLASAVGIPMRMGIHYWDNISRTRPWLEGFTAVGALELTNHGELAARYGEIALNARKKWEPLGLDAKYLVHWEAADAADPGDGGHADETLRIIAKYAKSDDECRGVLDVARESINVFRFIYDNLAERAIAAGKSR